MTFVIGEREIGEKFPPFIIPEIGINHGGSFEIAIKMVEAAPIASTRLLALLIKCFILTKWIVKSMEMTGPTEFCM